MTPEIPKFYRDLLRHLKRNLWPNENMYEPICEGLKPFFANLKMCSFTSSADNFNHVGTLRRYGKADFEIPLLQNKRINVILKIVKGTIECNGCYVCV